MRANHSIFRVCDLEITDLLIGEPVVNRFTAEQPLSRAKWNRRDFPLGRLLVDCLYAVTEQRRHILYRH